MFFHGEGCKCSGLSCSNPAEEGRQGGVLHEHPEYCSACAEVSLLTCKMVISCTKNNITVESVSVLFQVPQWDPRVHEVCGAGCAETISSSWDTVPARWHWLNLSTGDNWSYVQKPTCSSCTQLTMTNVWSTWESSTSLTWVRSWSTSSPMPRCPRRTS